MMSSPVEFSATISLENKQTNKTPSLETNYPNPYDVSETITRFISMGRNSRLLVRDDVN
jgi:hypothetical protein